MRAASGHDEPSLPSLRCLITGDPRAGRPRGCTLPLSPCQGLAALLGIRLDIPPRRRARRAGVARDRLDVRRSGARPHAAAGAALGPACLFAARAKRRPPLEARALAECNTHTRHPSCARGCPREAAIHLRPRSRSGRTPRCRLMPINRRVPLALLAEAMRHCIAATRRRVTVQYVRASAAEEGTSCHRLPASTASSRRRRCCSRGSTTIRRDSASPPPPFPQDPRLTLPCAVL